MTMNIRIEVRGLALCFLQPDADDWTILFACEKGVHDLMFSHPGLNQPVRLHDPEDKDLQIRFNIDAIVKEPPKSGDTDDIFNLNAEYAHGERLNLERSKNTVDQISMSVPFAELDGHRRSSSEYFVQRQDYPGQPVVSVGKIATMLSFEFKVSSELVMTVWDGTVEVNRYPIPFRNGKSATLSLNNDCGVHCTHNDSLDLYELVVDRTQRNLKFASGKVIKHHRGLQHRNISTEKSPYGNCDPAWSDPPPGP